MARSLRRKAHLRGTVAHQADALALARDAGDVVVVERGVPRSLVMRCPDGCGDILTVNLDPRAGPAWRLYQKDGATTLFPSVWRDTGCRAHFILWDDVVFWIGEPWHSHERAELRVRVAERLTNHFRSFADIADELNEIPWSVLVECRRLVREGRALEGRDDQQGLFRSVHQSSAF